MTQRQKTPYRTQTELTEETVTPPDQVEQMMVEQSQLEETSPTMVIEKVQEPSVPVIIKAPHQNPEPNRKPENIQRRNVPRFIRN